jgi:phosphonopyruvate decarboxylase
VIRPVDFFESLRRSEFTYFTGVPDSLLKDLCAYINDHVPSGDHIINANEGAAIGLAAGYHLATGRVPVVYLQNSGLGNAVNPLLSLADPAVYGVPILLIVGWRGEPGINDEPQHVAQGKRTPDLLNVLGIPYETIGPASTDFDGLVASFADQFRQDPRPRAMLIRKGTFEPYEPATSSTETKSLTRSVAISEVLSSLHPDEILVATTGMSSREVWAYREAHGQPHDRDFLTVGSMGHTSQIALGLAQQLPGRTIYCLDGDGAILMHMGSLAIIGTQAPANLRHVVINNGAHDSVGGQPTAMRSLELTRLARACNYAHAESVASQADVPEAIARLRSSRGPALLEVRVASRATTEAGRPTTSPLENKRALMRALGSDIAG